jgi:hypothetical protein
MVGQKIAPTDLIHNCRLHDMSHEQTADARINTSLANYMCPDPIGHLIAPVLSCITSQLLWNGMRLRCPAGLRSAAYTFDRARISDCDVTA